MKLRTFKYEGLKSLYTDVYEICQYCSGSGCVGNLTQYFIKSVYEICQYCSGSGCVGNPTQYCIKSFFEIANFQT